MGSLNTVASTAINGFLSYVEKKAPSIVEEVSKLAKEWGESQGIGGIELRRVSSVNPGAVDAEIDSEIEKKF